MFSRIKSFFTPKLNATNHRPAQDESIDSSKGGNWSDSIKPHMPSTLIKEQNNITNINHRAAQIRFNFTGWQFSHGIAEKLLSKTPYPFTYAEPFKSEANESETENPNQVSKRSEQELRAKSNAIALQDESGNQNAFTPGGSQLPLGDEQGKEFESELDTTPKTKYIIKNELVNKYHTQWSELDARRKNMFFYFKRSIGYGLGINSAAIIRKEGIKDKKAFWVFSGDQIIKIKGTHRIPTHLDIEWPPWGTIYEEKDSGFLESAIEEDIKIGDECVYVVPIIDSKSPRGEPYIVPIWDTMLYKQQNRFLHSYFLWKGGILSKYFRFPRTMGDDFRRRVEQDSKKPLGGIAQIIEYPPGKSPEHVDKMFEHEEVLGLDINWEEANSLNSQDSPYPESFVKGNVESGAMGGIAPKVDKAKEDLELMRMFKMLDPIIKDINITFFGATEEEMNDCIIIPWQDEQSPEEDEMEELGKDKDKAGLEREIEDFENPPKEEPKKQKSNTYTAKKNSITEDGMTVYIGNLFKEGWLPQDDGSQEWLDGSEIKKFVDDPKAVKEGYIQYEHPKGKPEEILKSSATARYKVIGYNDEMKTDITEFYVFDKDAPDEIFTSPMYYSRDVTMPDGKIAQSELDVRNAVFTSSPRSMGATSAKKL